MRNGIYTLFLGCLFLGFTACNTGSGTEDEPEVPYNAEKWKAILVDGPWVYDLPWYDKHRDQLKNDIMDFAERHSNPTVWTSEFKEKLETTLDSTLITSDDLAIVKLEFFDDGRVTLTNKGKGLNGYFGYSRENDSADIRHDLILFTPAAPGERGEVIMHGKEVNQGVIFEKFRMHQNSFTRTDYIQGLADTTFTMTYKYIRK